MNLYEEILARLQNGEEADKIADELVGALNKAKNDHESNSLAKQREADMISDMEVILELVHDFIEDYYCETEEDSAKLEECFKDLDAKSVITTLEEAGAMAVQLTESLNDLEALFNQQVKCPKGAKTIKTPSLKFEVGSKKDADHIINTFLKSIGL